MLHAPSRTPHQLAGFLPPDTYEIGAPLDRTRLVYARLTTPGGDQPLEASMALDDDVLSVHLDEFGLRATSGGQTLFDGRTEPGSASICAGGVAKEVSILGAGEIIQVFLPQVTMANAAAEILGLPTMPLWEGFRTDPELVRRVTRAAAAAIEDDPANRLAADILSLAVLERLLTAGGSGNGRRGSGPSRGGLAGWQVRRVLDHLEDRIGEEVTIAELSGEAGLSPFHFIRAFRQSTGLTPHAWLFRRRIARMKSLLAGTDLGLSEIARAVGYHSASAGSAAFRRGTGYSTGEWRRLSGG